MNINRLFLTHCAFIFTSIASPSLSLAVPKSEFLIEKSLRALETRAGRQNIFMSQLNDDFRYCFDRPCPISQIYNIEIRNGQNEVINPKAQGLFDDNHKLCTLEKGCQWRLWTAGRPHCKTAPCLVDRFDFFFSQSFDPPTPLNTQKDRTTYSSLVVPRDAILDVYEWKGQRCDKIGTNVIFWGFSADGSIKCGIPDAPNAEAAKPVVGMYHEDKPVLNFLMDDEPYMTSSKEIQKIQIEVQTKIVSESANSLIRTAITQGGFKPCNAGAQNRCFKKANSDLFLSDETQIIAGGKGIDLDLRPCTLSKNQPNCLPVRVDLSLECQTAECLEIIGEMKVTIDNSSKPILLNIGARQVKPTPAECTSGLYHIGWDNDGTPVCQGVTR